MSQPKTDSNAPDLGNNSNMTGTPQGQPTITAGTGSSAPAAAAAPVHFKKWVKDCAVLAGNPSGPVIGSGKALGASSKIEARLVVQRLADMEPWMGFQLEFPIGKSQEANESSGFGVRHKCKSSIF